MRVEVSLDEKVLDTLEKLAKLDGGRSRKNYMEKVLSDHAKENKSKTVNVKK